MNFLLQLHCALQQADKYFLEWMRVPPHLKIILIHYPKCPMSHLTICPYQLWCIRPQQWVHPVQNAARQTRNTFKSTTYLNMATYIRLHWQNCLSLLYTWSKQSNYFINLKINTIKIVKWWYKMFVLVLVIKVTNCILLLLTSQIF